ncbi:ATP-binding protein [Amycolatopsis sp. YIM 10]|uniref:ATP-binding protein n=1 Tax=Amycolatopsis sp. YIM 10 TaxID=2653857 RepID=UPI0012A796AF|nr:ATP-binding protein [Amycolatopsis sp. YIM 10]QFU85524.1 Anti-sigma-F factor RsbW [Amycolatopsis sp. YIM 10]
MTNGKQPALDEIGPLDDIEVRLGADLAHLPIIRALVSNLAVRADFDLDTIADLRLAIDEACSTLITRAQPGSLLTCRFVLEDGQLRFRGTVPSADEEAPSTGSFGWRVLTTLADSAASWVDVPAGGEQVVHIELAKRRADVRPGA